MPLSYFSIQTTSRKSYPLALVCLIIAFLSVNFSINAQTIDKSLKTPQAVIDDFMGKRFGMFIHWGPVNLRGTEIGWSRDNAVPVKEYDVLYQEFNPVLFNADAWAKAAKDAGMKYLTIAAKHHDGFCLWPSAYTAYDIMSTPYKKDVVGELAKACKKNGIELCIYYSVLDWYHINYPRYSPNQDSTVAGTWWYKDLFAVNTPKDSIAPHKEADMGKYVAYMKNQLKELITGYHPYMLWFDGNWESPWTKADGEEMYKYIKSLDPAVIINNRLGKGSSPDLGSEIVGDYATPEGHIGALNMKDPWESCITMCNQWAWKPNDKMKSKKECIQTLVQTASGNGNLLFNVGPMPDGRIEARQISRLKEIGNWLERYGEAIYNTKGGPYKGNKIFATTRKDNKIYVHVLNAENKQLSLPALKDIIIKKAYFLKGQSVQFTTDEENIHITLPAKMPDEDCSVVVLELDKNAEQLPVVKN